MRLRGGLCASLLTLLVFVCGVALAARSYPDRAGDVARGAGPDIVSVTVSNTRTTLTFGVRFAASPPLRVNSSEGWVEMLLIGIDVPPLGPRPVPHGDWRGLDFALGTHGPSTAGQLVRLGAKVPSTRPVATFTVETRGSTLRFSVPRRALGNPAWFTFLVAAARETAVEDEAQAGADLAPARGTFRYVLTG